MSNSSFHRYWLAWQRQLPWILGLTLLVTMLVYEGAKRLPATQQVHFSYLVSLAERETGSVYQFDGYYALQATDLFTTTVSQWVQTPEVIVAAYQAANLAVPASDPRTLLQHVVATKTAPQLVTVTVKDSDPQVAQKLTEGLQTVMNRNVELYHEQGTPALTFRIVATPSWLGVQRLDVRLITGATFILMLIVASNVVLLRESIRTI
jgi:hypothetical protein